MAPKNQDVRKTVNPDGEVLNSNLQSPEGWGEEKIGYAPYWSPAEGACFRGIVLARDDRDPEFVRILMQATAPLVCYEGPVVEAEEIQVALGEQFTVSAYAALPLMNYIGEEVFVKAVKKRDIKGGKQELWIFKLMCSAETKKKVAARLAEAARNNPLTA